MMRMGWMRSGVVVPSMLALASILMSGCGTSSGTSFGNMEQTEFTVDELMGHLVPGALGLPRQIHFLDDALPVLEEAVANFAG